MYFRNIKNRHCLKGNLFWSILIETNVSYYRKLRVHLKLNGMLIKFPHERKKCLVGVDFGYQKIVFGWWERKLTNSRHKTAVCPNQPKNFFIPLVIMWGHPKYSYFLISQKSKQVICEMMTRNLTLFHFFQTFYIFIKSWYLLIKSSRVFCW